MSEQPPKPPELVLVSHGNLERVKALLAEDPSQLNVMYLPWKETPLGAASHVGNRPIAEYLLEQGAPMTITTAAMLGRTGAVKAFLQADPSLANSAGAHDISLLYHAAMSGKVEIADMIVAHGGKTDAAGHAILGATQFGHKGMVAWLLEKGGSPNVKNFAGKTALTIAKATENQELIELLEAHGGVESEPAES